MTAYYNEFDHNAAEWLRELIKQGLIPSGEVDERSIKDVGADDLLGYRQCHFFAGVGGWSLALRLAGWPEDQPVWTGSCPCQPYSTAGKQQADKDERDLWPEFYRLIRACRPQYVFGEQVENAIKHGWLDRVYTDLEAENYTVGSVVLGAHSIGAPHRRQRLYWGGVRVADNFSRGCEAGGELRGMEKIYDGKPNIAMPLAESSSYGSQSLGDGHAELCDRIRNARAGWRYELADGNRTGKLAENSNGGGCRRRNNGDQTGSGREIQTPGLGNDCGVSHAESDGRDARRSESDGRSIASGCGAGGVSHTESTGLQQTGQSCAESAERTPCRCTGGGVCKLDDMQGVGRGVCNASDIGTADGKINAFADADRSGCGVADSDNKGLERRNSGKCPGQCSLGSGSLAGFPWGAYRLIYCRDGKIRRIPAESLLFRVADGLSGDVDGGGVVGISERGGFPLTTKKEGRAMLLKGYGNAIVPQIAAEFVSALMETWKGILK